MQVYRHSFIADYTLYNISSGTLSNIANTTDKIQLAVWSPVEPVIVSSLRGQVARNTHNCLVPPLRPMYWTLTSTYSMLHLARWFMN